MARKTNKIDKQRQHQLPLPSRLNTGANSSLASRTSIFVDRCRQQAAQRLTKSPDEITLKELIRNSVLTACIVYNRRFFVAGDNPRLKRPATGTLRLYHFTSSAYVNAIKQDGIQKGDVPVRIAETGEIQSEEDFNNVTWLTSDLDPGKQGWSGGNRDYRLTVRVEADDPNLWSWANLSAFLGMSPKSKRILEKGNYPRRWWVHVNQPILPSMIVEYEKLPSLARPIQMSSGLDSFSIRRELILRGLADEEALLTLGWK